MSAACELDLYSSALLLGVNEKTPLREYFGKFCPRFKQVFREVVAAPRDVWEAFCDLHLEPPAVSGVSGRSFVEVAKNIALVRIDILAKASGRNAWIRNADQLEWFDADRIATTWNQTASQLNMLPTVDYSRLAMAIEKECDQVECLPRPLRARYASDAIQLAAMSWRLDSRAETAVPRTASDGSNAFDSRLTAPPTNGAKTTAPKNRGGRQRDEEREAIRQMFREGKSNDDAHEVYPNRTADDLRQIRCEVRNEKT